MRRYSWLKKIEFPSPHIFYARYHELQTWNRLCNGEERDLVSYFHCISLSEIKLGVEVSKFIQFSTLSPFPLQKVCKRQIESTVNVELKGREGRKLKKLDVCIESRVMNYLDQKWISFYSKKEKEKMIRNMDNIRRGKEKRCFKVWFDSRNILEQKILERFVIYTSFHVYLEQRKEEVSWSIWFDDISETRFHVPLFHPLSQDALYPFQAYFVSLNASQRQKVDMKSRVWLSLSIFWMCVTSHKNFCVILWRISSNQRWSWKWRP